MKKSYVFPIVMILVLITLSSCNPMSQDAELKTLQISSEAIFDQYHIFIEYSDTPSETKEADKNSQISTFDILIKNEEGTEVDRLSLNDGPYDFSALNAEDNPKVVLNDYNNDGNPDFALGFPSSKGASEWKYILFSLNDEGKISRLPVKGYKEEDYIYSKKCGVFPEFRNAFPSDGNDFPSFFVGVEQEGVFKPAQYLWKDEVFVFEQEIPFIISQNTTPDSQTVSIVQTIYDHPKMPSDKDFSMYQAYVLGEFDLIVSNEEGRETSRINLNSLFDGQELGWAGPFPIVFEDYNDDGDVEFAFGQAMEGSAEFQYILISISKDGKANPIKSRGYKESPYIYDSSYDGFFNLLDKPDIGFSVMLSDGGWSQGEYLWDQAEEEFVFRKSQE